jgi:4-amino-4-deoxy-L-arabinose transferase-like glycosyltransferase
MSPPQSRWQTLPDRAHSIAWLIAGFTLLRLLLAAAVPLLPQEAYYWSWSRHLDWSYFDHPPLATYSIALTTAVFGQTTFGIKLASVLWSLGWNLLWARLILDMYADRRLAFWSLAALNLSVAYELFGVGPTPDAPLIFAWTGAIWAVWRLSQSGDGRWWFGASAFVGLSWLGKYSGVLLLPIVFVYLLTSPRLRHWLLKPQPYLAMLLAAAVFAPVLWWNSQHDWVSLAFQSSRRVGQMAGFKPRYFVMLVATQLLMLTPYLFVIAFAALFRGTREWLAGRSDERTRLLLLSGVVPIVLFTAISLRSIVKINWLAPAYWSLVILGVRHVLALDGGLRRLLRGLASSLAILLAAGVLVAIPNLPIAGDLNSWSGWKEAAARVEHAAAAARDDGHEVFVFSPNYRISSLIRFYLPGQPRTYAQDIYGAPALQFDYFPLTSDLKGATAILVLSDQDQGDLDRERLKAYFDTVERVDVVEAKAFGKVTRRIEIYRATNYKGHPRASAVRAAQ